MVISLVIGNHSCYSILVCLVQLLWLLTENSKEFWNSFVNSGKNESNLNAFNKDSNIFDHAKKKVQFSLHRHVSFLSRVGNTVSSLLMERKWTLQPLVFSFAVRLALDKDDIGKLSLGKTSVISSNQPNRRGWRQLFQTDWWAVNLRSIYSFRRTIYQCCQMVNLIFWKIEKKMCF